MPVIPPSPAKLAFSGTARLLTAAHQKKQYYHTLSACNPPRSHRKKIKHKPLIK
jgi:hypothetical protein